jgi:class 3 adenylate cyclase
VGPTHHAAFTNTHLCLIHSDTQVLQEGQNGILVVVKSCDDYHTYVLNGPVAVYVGPGDLHDPSFNGVAAEFLHEDDSIYEHCHHNMFIYPTSKFKSSSESNDPAIYTSVVALIFVFAAAVFLLHDWQMRRLQNKVVQQAAQNNALVSELFPGGVRDQLLSQTNDKKVYDSASPAKDSIMDFVSDQNNSKESSRPIAELFPEATVLFADIAGFTAWSSIREPTQVFTLLESVFQAFDVIAKKYGVFKVETVGDCYVCVVGVPVYNKDHAMVMARFARDCNERVVEVLRDLEMTLGPDTGELAMRFGIHSGPVTAGVLRGDRARFQLFGDTVNTAARVESSGKRSRIHISEQTASYIMAAGKSNWVTLREDAVEAKGKGMLQTYWLHNKTPEKATSSHTPGSEMDDAELQDDPRAPPTAAALRKSEKNAAQIKDKKVQRLVEWNSELLLQLLKQVVARRSAINGRKTASSALTSMAANIGNGSMVVDEVAEVINMPEFDARACGSTPKTDTVTVSDGAAKQLQAFVAVIARLYRENPFHNFEHASHVTMSVSKLLSRIVAPREEAGDEKDKESLLHDHTYGITSDPLTQFAVVLSALIHDVDHRGVPNFLLIKEEEGLANVYNGKSVAEQNSVDIAWASLMSPEFEELRGCIFGDISELRRFRQLLVNSVIATDIFDKELGVLRKSRWEKAFNAKNADGSRTEINRKATIVIEHLIQASDVAHTMQHWHVYQKWNERLFKEMYEAYLSGRSDKDPSPGWYQGEIGFFDFYIIPLAKKLKECGVFGVSSDEYLNYAVANRREWEDKGEFAVEVMKVKYGPQQEGDEKFASGVATSLSPKAADILSRFSKK